MRVPYPKSRTVRENGTLLFWSFWNIDAGDAVVGADGRGELLREELLQGPRRRWIRPLQPDRSEARTHDGRGSARNPTASAHGA